MTAPKLKRVRAGWSLRLRYGDGERCRFLITLERRADAERRAEALAELAAILARSGRHTEAPVILRKGAAQTTDAGFAEVQAYARELCAKPKGGEVASGDARSESIPTVREFGRSWTTGKLHERYPAHIPLKDTAKDDHSRLSRHVYPVIGDKRLDQVTLDDYEEILRRIPESAHRSRRHVGGTVARILRMAVYPCRLLERSPLPPGSLPRANSRKAMAYLYPSEDAKLMACTVIPYEYRLLWGFLSREGMREGEALALTWECVDLEHGMVRLDENKTDDPRSWALGEGVARALALHRKHYAPEAKGADPVFLQRSKFGLAETLREHLKRAGVDRAELYVTNATRQQMRVHDLRGTFVTLSLAAGKAERWVMARTGHTTSAMIGRYHRTAMSFAELNLGELRALDLAIPELAVHAARATTPARVGREVGHSRANYRETKATPTGIEPVLPA